jgi:membrane protease YdiL (CAAX protease family)
MVFKSGKKDIYLPDPATGRLEAGDVKTYFTTFGLGLFFFSLATSFSVEIIALTVYFISPSLLESTLFSNILSVAAIYGIAFPILFCITRRLPDARPEKRSIGTKNFFITVCLMFTCTVGGNIISNFIASVLSMLRGEALENPVNTEILGESFWINLIFAVLLAPILEELVFRKYLCEKLLPLGEGYAVIISALVFGLIHGNVFQCFYCIANGLLWGYIYVKTGKLRYTIAGHMLMNFFCGALPSLLLSFIDEEVLASGVIGDIITQAPFYLGLLAIEFIQYAAAIFGLVVFMKHRRNISLERGVLPPPDEKRISLVMSNVGMILAVCIVGLNLLGSI